MISLVYACSCCVVVVSVWSVFPFTCVFPSTFRSHSLRVASDVTAIVILLKEPSWGINNFIDLKDWIRQGIPGMSIPNKRLPKRYQITIQHFGGKKVIFNGWYSTRVEYHLVLFNGRTGISKFILGDRYIIILIIGTWKISTKIRHSKIDHQIFSKI